MTRDRRPDAFGPVRRVATLFDGFPRPWFVAGGWGLDLFLGRVTRSHEDVEIAVFRSDQATLRDWLRTWSLRKVVPGRPSQSETWERSETLELPVHEIHAHRETGDPTDLEILLNESDASRWVFRRSAEVTLPLSRVGRKALRGIPILVPEIVLLYKAKEPRDRDKRDFAVAHPHLGKESRAWLRSALEVCHPGHPWLRKLSPEGHRT